MPTLPTRRFVLRAGVAAVAASLLAACERAPIYQFEASDISQASPLGEDLSLPDFNGTTRTLKDFQGKAVVVFFGFIQCPDVCPTTLAELAQVVKALGPDGERVQVLFVTVDPDRDTPDIVRDYVTQFDPRFLGLVGTPEDLARTAKSFKVFYSKVPSKTDDSYTMDHSAGLYVFDPKGKVRLYARYGQSVESLTNDIRHVLS